MKKLNLMQLLVFTILVFGAMSCNNKKAENSDTHTSETSLDWAGTYSGILPCADCEGISTELTLNTDGTYTLTNIYLVEEENREEITGKNFHWDESGSIITLDGLDENGRSPYIKVEENQLRWLDLDKNMIEGALENNYILTKNGNPLVENKRWQLVEIYGKEVDGTSETHYIIFHSDTGQIEAKANCNLINLGYKIKNELTVEFTPGSMTMMACPDENVEQELLQVFEEADNLSTDGENLSLNKARMAPLAIFKLVEQN